MIETLDYPINITFTRAEVDLISLSLELSVEQIVDSSILLSLSIYAPIIE